MTDWKNGCEMASIAEKIRTLRIDKGIAQHEIADIILTNQPRVSRIENGEDKYSEFELQTLKEHFDIEGMPLTEFEREAFKGRLCIWRDVIRSRDISEAYKMKSELCKITNIEPFDGELVTLYHLFEALLYIAEINVSAAEEALHSLGKTYDEMNHENRYYYDFHMGALHATKDDFEGALTYYRKALSAIKSQNGTLPDDEERIYHNIAICYTDLEFPGRAIAFLNNIPKPNFSDRMTAHSLGIDIMRAVNYFKVGLHEEAEEILNDCLMRATSMGDRFYVGLSLQSLGGVNMRIRNWAVAEGYFVRALECFKEDTSYHAWAFYFTFRCRVETENLVRLESELNKIKTSFDNNIRYSIHIETLMHIIRLKRNISRYNKSAVEYIENVAIPRFIKKNHRLEALECYKLLEQYEEKAGTQRKVIQINKVMREILERMV